MKLDRKIDAGIVDSNSAKTTSSFSIATSSHMFNILSSGLYSDKIKAVLREVSCNAMDAHIMADKPDLPIEVKLPNTVDPFFYVKDFGPGLDEDEMRQLYTTYGWSAKQDSDAVTGAFGLGSKSPFAYTHSFTVQSAKNGRMWTMTAHQDEDGKPVITKVDESEATSEWPNGVMVTFPVEASDFDEFEEKAQEVFRWFHVKPNVLGSTMDLSEPTCDFRWKNFGFSKQGYQVAVVTGNVRYPVDTSILKSKTVMSDPAKGLLERSLTLWLPIGSVMMTPSRETLEYTKKTVEALRIAIETAADSLYESVVDALRMPASSELEMHRRVYGLRESFPSSVRDALDKQFAAVEGELKTLVEATWLHYKSPMVGLENWVGEGASPLPPFQRTAGGEIARDDAFRALPDSSWVPSGARVYAMVGSRTGRRSRMKVSRREVVNGRFVGTTEDVHKLSFHIDRVPPLFVLDTKSGITAVKLHLENRESVDRDSERILGIVVAGTGREPVEKALAYAKRLQDHTVAFEGCSPVVVSRDLSAELHDIRVQRKRTHTKTREEWLELEINEASLTQSSFRELRKSQTTLEEFESFNEQRFYLLTYKTGDIRATVGEHELDVQTHRFVELIADGSLTRMLEIADIDAQSVVCVENKQQLKALRLEKNGYQNLITALADKFRADACLRAELVEMLVPAVPSLETSAYMQWSEVGVAGFLALLKVRGSKVWETVQSRYPLHPVVMAAEAYAGMVNARGVPLRDGTKLATFFREVPYAKYAFGIVSEPVRSRSKFLEDANESLRHAELLNLSNLCSMAKTDPDAVCTMLDVVFLLSGDVLKAMRQEQMRLAA